MTQMRDALVAKLEDDFVAQHAMTVVYDNAGEIDLDHVTSPFLNVSFTFYGAVQSCLGESPFHRTHGSMRIILMSKSGTGLRERLVLMDALTELFKFQVLGGLHVQVPTPGRTAEQNGWHSATLLVPFFADSNA
jgi:hypothetical protein